MTANRDLIFNAILIVVVAVLFCVLRTNYQWPLQILYNTEKFKQNKTKHESKTQKNSKINLKTKVRSVSNVIGNCETFCFWTLHYSLFIISLGTRYADSFQLNDYNLYEFFVCVRCFFFFFSFTFVIIFYFLILFCQIKYE